MNNRKYGCRAVVLLAVMLVWLCGITVMAEGASGDNSLSTLGITTEGVTVSPEFYYSTIEYEVTVPAGTTQLELNPVPSNENAWIVDITGTELVNGETTTVITVSAENGSQYSYYLYVKEAAGTETVTPVEAEVQTEPETEEETEPETEDPRYVKVERESLQAAETTISALKTEAGSYRDRMELLMNILYGMIAFCVVLLFVVINLLLKKKDLKAELRNYRGYGYPQDGGYPQQAPAGKENRKAAKKAEKQAAKEAKKEAKRTDKKGRTEKNTYGQDSYEEPYYDQQNYGQQNYDQQGYGQQQGYDRQDYAEDYSWQEPQPMADDPMTVPKPAKAKKKAKKMPEYEKTQQSSDYQPQQGKSRDDVEITMIDL